MDDGDRLIDSDTSRGGGARKHAGIVVDATGNFPAAAPLEFQAKQN
jgi:hypothetical protein